MGPIAKKVSSELRKNRIARAIGLDATRPIPAQDMPPDQADWMRVFGVFGGVIFSLLDGRVLRRTQKRFEELEQTYMPGGPPMSPVMDSYFITWQTCDFRVAGSETLATIAADLAPQLGLREFGPDFRTLAHSFNSMYEVRSRSRATIGLADLITGETYEVAVADSVAAEPGTLWLARLLPPRSADGFWSSVSTPYVLVGEEAASAWSAYVDRNLAGMAGADRRAKYVSHMKNGAHETYWLDYVVDGYVGEDSVSVLVAGVPDRPETLPHSPENEGNPTFALGPNTSPHLRVRARLAHLAEETGALEAALEMCAAACGAEDEVPKDPNGGPHPLVLAFASLGLLDAGRTSLLDVLSEQPDLLADERTIVDELLAGWFSVYEVQQVELDERIEVRDVLRRRRFWVNEKSATRGVVPGDLLAGWVHVGGDRIGFEGALVHVLRRDAKPFVQVVLAMRDAARTEYPSFSSKQRSGVIVPGILAAHAKLLRNRPRPRLVNHEGHKLLLGEARYAVADRPRAFERLVAEFGEPDGDIFAVASQDGSVLEARLELLDSELRVTANSKERLERVKGWIASTLGAFVEHRIDVFEDPTSTAHPPLDARSRAEPIPPEAQALLRSVMAEHLEKWIDQPIPDLDGKTPRQAVKSKRGQNHVKVMLLQQEEMLSNHEQLDAPIDFRPVWKKLGLDYPEARS